MVVRDLDNERTISQLLVTELTLEVIVVVVAILTQYVWNTGLSHRSLLTCLLILLRHSSQLANQRGDFCGGGGAIVIG